MKMDLFVIPFGFIDPKDTEESEVGNTSVIVKCKDYEDLY